jgi:hypothetical protein
MSRLRTVLLASALAAAAVPAHAQAASARKMGAVVREGMSPAQARAVLGEPVRVRHDGALAYLEYPCGACGGNDYVVVRDCRVVAARFATPARLLVQGGAGGAAHRSAADCALTARDAHAAAPLPASAARNGQLRPTDVNPAGAMPVEQPRLVPPGTPANPPAAAPSADATPAASAAPSADATPSAGAASASAATSSADAAPAGGADHTPTAAADTGGTTGTPTAGGGSVPAGSSASGGGAGDVAAQQESPDEWRRRLTLRRPATHLVAVPAASISSPTAFGVEMGEAFVGLTYQARTRFTHVSDGAAMIGFGLGDRERYVGLEVTATSYSTLRGGGPLQTGGLSFKLHRALSPDMGVAVGVENAAQWGGSDAGRSPYVVLTRLVHLAPDATRPLSTLAITGGVGGGRFRSQQQIVNDSKTPNVFGAIGLQVAEPVSVTADWTGQDLFTAVSIAPIRRVPLVVNAGLADLTGRAGDGVRFILSAGLGFRWLPPFF